MSLKTNGLETFSLLDKTLFLSELEAKKPLDPIEKLDAIAIVLFQSRQALNSYIGCRSAKSRKMDTTITNTAINTAIEAVNTSLKAAKQAKYYLEEMKDQPEISDLSKETLENYFRFSYLSLEDAGKESMQIEFGLIQEKITNYQLANFYKRQELVSNPAMDVELPKNIGALIQSRILKKANNNLLEIKGIEPPRAIFQKVIPKLEKSMKE